MSASVFATITDFSSLALVLVIPIAFGTTLLTAAGLLPEKMTRLLAGTVIGLAVLTIAAHLAGTVAGRTPLVTAGILAAMLVTVIKLLPRVRPQWARAPFDKTSAVVFTVLFVVLFGASARLLVAEEGGWATHAQNAYGDLGFHVATIAALQHDTGLIPNNPILAGQPLIYPFFANLFSTLLVTAGASLPHAVVLPALLLIPLALTLLYRFALTLTASRSAALIATILILCGGSSLGWLPAAHTVISGDQSLLDALHNPQRDFTGHSTDKQGYHMVNPLISMFLPQRAFLFGFPLTLAMLLLLQQAQHTRRRLPYAAAGMLAGILPLFHAHSALAAGVLVLAWIIASPTRHWLVFVSTASLVGLPAISYYLSGSAAAWPQPQLWWMAHGTHPLLFWLKNSGVLVPLTILGCFLPAPRGAKITAAAGLALFAAANLWRFAPWEWDNTKIFIYWLVFTAPLLGWLLWYSLTSRKLAGLAGSHRTLQAASIVVLLAHTAAGALDVYNVAKPSSRSYVIWDAAAIEAARAIAQETPPGAVILTAPIHNSPAALAGRPVYLGFPGHIWSHGGDYGQRETAIRDVYQGRRSELPEPVPRYLLTGPVEQQLFAPINVQPDWELLAAAGPYRLYQRITAER